MPEVSVILPVFNGARTISRAVGSILDQSLEDIELIVLDDGSTDETAAIVESLTDSRLKLIRCGHRRVASAANAATTFASASFIARMDADDFAYPTRLERQLQLIHQQALDVVGCQVRILDESRQVVPSMRRYERWINQETIDRDQISALRFVEFPLVNPTILAKRNYFELEFRHGEFPEDYDLMLRAAEQGLRFGKVAEVLLDWIDGPDRLTRSDSRYSSDAFARCRRMRQVKSVDLWGVGQAGKPWLRWLRDRGITVRHGYDVSHRKVNATIHGVLIRHPSQLVPSDGTPLIIAVGAEHARQQILPRIRSRGYVSGRDAWFVA